MSSLNNLFDAAMARADDTILDVMGMEARITSGSLAGQTITGVFDDPENVAYAGAGVRIDGTSPSLFVKSAGIGQLQRPDTLIINGEVYWVDRIGPDDGGSCHVFLGTGTPPASSRRR